MIKNNKGQSLVELVFALGVVGLVLTGAVVLILNSLASQSKKFDHKKATELASVVTEELVAQKNNKPLEFWVLPTKNGASKTEFPGYLYKIEFTRVSGTGTCTTAPAVINCARATITVSLLEDPTKNVVISRFFVRN